MTESYFEAQIQAFKEKFTYFQNYIDYHIFTLICIKYFYFSEQEFFIDEETLDRFLTDGANDGGIDAIFNDPTSDENDVIVVQSKYYDKSSLTKEGVFVESYKIQETLNDLKHNKIEGYNEKLITAYKNAINQMENNASIKVVFFSSYKPKNKRESNKLEKTLRDYFIKYNYDVEMNLCGDIEAQIELCDNGKMFVDFDKIKIDKAGNYLEYEDSVIVNISALSLQDLQNRRRNGLLGMNLRYYVKQKVVDSGIEQTIKKEPENFWYKNNGILIICDDYDIDGTELKLYNFSVINGGQTTNRIGKLDINKDFYLQCKVVKSKGDDNDSRNNFALEIAEASNSQKPIKKSDLKANTLEQLKLKENLSRYGVYYITKKGDKAPKQYTEIGRAHV